MQGFWRYPVLPAGMVLLVLGFGNWMVSHSKILEYERRAHGPDVVERSESLQEFTHLTPRTNAMVLERLHRRLGDYGVADAKRDFYTVVQSGGRLIAVVGLLLIGVGLLQRWRERRINRSITLPGTPAARA